VGTAGHLTAELFMALTGTTMTHVPYKGTAPVLTDLIAGNVDLTFIQSAFYEWLCTIALICGRAL
jgi:tripartite-type tricarboxylate transporter receptor subunit TctC